MSVKHIRSEEYKPPHERNSGWADHELEDGALHLERADQIAKNPKYLEAIRKHSEKRAKHHHEMARRAHMLAKSGRISPKAMAKMEES